jgi:hypothetical protein
MVTVDGTFVPCACGYPEVCKEEEEQWQKGEDDRTCISARNILC